MSERRSACDWDPRYERVETVSDDGEVIGTRFEPFAAASPVPGAGQPAVKPALPAARRRVFAIAASALAIACVVAAVWLVVGA